ncbi:MAG TPA: ImmA/IrrE family metallo-endopeptidase [Dehalococcoidia bacterium]|nr:ImmA/IrrE family metallo-endopeptidase [Dehalococcoidia bacterium]
MGTKQLNSCSLTSEVVPVFINPEQAKELIIERARQLVNRLVEDRGHDKPPFLPEEFARLQGIKKIVKADLGRTSAVLLRFDDGYVIKVNQNHNLARQNFSCTHEIGHTLFSEAKLERYIQNIEYRTFDPQGHEEARSTARERLCDIAATELLMPESVFRKYLSGFGVSVHSIERLANIFKVSIRAATWRIAEVSTEPCIALLWQLWPTNKPKGLRLAWCVGPGRNSRGKANYMPMHTLVRHPSKLHKAYEYDRSVKSSKLFKVDNAVKRLPMESKGFGHDGTRYVVSLALLNR